MFKPAIVIPVYNHEKTVAGVVGELIEHGHFCIMVNDGSNDSCTHVLRSLHAQYPKRTQLVEHTVNQGKGAAVSTGLQAALQSGFTHALQVDADGQHNLTDIAVFLEQSAAHPLAIICGYPVYDDSVPKHRFYARYLTHVWVWINTLSFRIKDSMCGFRVYPLSSICRLLDHTHMFPRMSFDTEVLVRADWAGIPIINQPTQVHYPDDGVSHFLAVKDNVLITANHTRLFFGMLIRSPILVYRWFSGYARKGTSS